MKEGIIVDRSSLADKFPTHFHSSEFWESLGRVVATFGLLEEVLGKAIFSLTATRTYQRDELNQAYLEWFPKLEKALTDQLWNLSESYAKAVRKHQDAPTDNLDNLIQSIQDKARLRNALCHGSWRPPDANGKSNLYYFNKKLERFDTPIDTEYLATLQKDVTSLICDVMDSVSSLGLQFPGTNHPG